MDLVVIAVTTAMSLTSLPVAFFLNKLDLMRDQRAVLAVGIPCLFLSALVPILVIRRRYRNVDFIIYIFAMFCWSACIDLFIGLELDGYVKGFIGFYLVEGEPYLNSSHGTMITYWDGTVHYLLQILGIVLYTMQRSYREVALYWCGSFLNSLPVLVIGALLGHTDVKPSILLNFLYALLPLCVGMRLIHNRPLQARLYHKAVPIYRRPLDCAFLLYFIFASCLAAFRGLAALGADIAIVKEYVATCEPVISDPTAFPKVQMLMFMSYYLLYYTCVIDSLLSPGDLWMADWAIIHAGASAQAQFSYITAAVHPRTPKDFQPPTAGPGAVAFWVTNLLLLLMPQVFALRCWLRPLTCGRTHSVDVAKPMWKSPAVRSYRVRSKKD